MRRTELYRKRRNWWGWMIFITTLLAVIFSQMGCAEFNATHIKFSDKAKKKLEVGYASYVDDLNVEFAFCCYGGAIGDTLYIYDVEIMWGFHKYNRMMVFPQYCMKRPVIWGHAHPRGYFSPSGIDQRTLKRTDYPAGVVITKVGKQMLFIYYRREG